MQETDFLGGFAKGLQVIEAFGETKPRLTITDVSRVTGLDRATARRCLLTLAQLGYAAYDGKFFELTPRILRLGQSYLSATPLPRLVQPYLDRLSEKVGQSASVSVLDGTEIIYVARAAQKRVMSINLMPGSRLPAYCSSMGRVLLASLPLTEARAIIEASERQANTPFTTTDPETLMEELSRICRQGYALIDQELELGLRSIAVPLEEPRGRVVAALNIGAPVAQATTEEMVKKYLPSMLEVKSELRSLLK